MRTLRGPRNELFPPYVAQQIRLALQKAVFAHDLERATKLDAIRSEAEAKKSEQSSPSIEIKKN